ncbi:hypothetical protein J7355_04715 [Endozoicomonas sp. G2_2]|uniref:hypothetical protein n=1 Tax=Endozoicomonas sp. G2_2 TaxID=2821092 RepID=UPI001ADB35F8|nr:hypothetical protein [Endozoicomonas sp. G2_2]MBO9469396.1 hypothetical protein [Endozoicomonas sp. G2_2]
MRLETRSLNSAGLLVLTVSLMAAGQLCMRRGMLAFGPIESAAAFGNLVWGGIISPGAIPFVWLGMSVYALAIMVWLQVLSRMDLSIAFPMMSLSYVLVYLGAALWPALDEAITVGRLAGTGLIMCGVALVAQSR